MRKYYFVLHLYKIQSASGTENAFGDQSDKIQMSGKTGMISRTVSKKEYKEKIHDIKYYLKHDWHLSSRRTGR